MGREKETVSRALSASSPDFRPRPPSLSLAPGVLFPPGPVYPVQEGALKTKKMGGVFGSFQVLRAHL